MNQSNDFGLTDAEVNLLHVMKETEDRTERNLARLTRYKLNTIHSMLASVREKMQVHSGRDAVLKAIQYGMLEDRLEVAAETRDRNDHRTGDGHDCQHQIE